MRPWLAADLDRKNVPCNLVHRIMTPAAVRKGPEATAVWLCWRSSA